MPLVSIFGHNRRSANFEGPSKFALPLNGVLRVYVMDNNHYPASLRKLRPNNGWSFPHWYENASRGAFSYL